MLLLIAEHSPSRNVCLLLLKWILLLQLIEMPMTNAAMTNEEAEVLRSMVASNSCFQLPSSNPDEQLIAADEYCETQCFTAYQSGISQMTDTELMMRSEETEALALLMAPGNRDPCSQLSNQGQQQAANQFCRKCFNAYFSLKNKSTTLCPTADLPLCRQKKNGPGYECSVITLEKPSNFMTECVPCVAKTRTEQRSLLSCIN